MLAPRRIGSRGREGNSGPPSCCHHVGPKNTERGESIPPTERAFPPFPDRSCWPQTDRFLNVLFGLPQRKRGGEIKRELEEGAWISKAAHEKHRSHRHSWEQASIFPACVIQWAVSKMA